MSRTKKCDSCPLKREEEGLKEEVLEGWDVWLGVKAERFDFDQMLSGFYQIISLQELPRNEMTVRTQSLVGVFLSEKHILEDERDFKK